VPFRQINVQIIWQKFKTFLEGKKEESMLLKNSFSSSLNPLVWKRIEFHCSWAYIRYTMISKWRHRKETTPPLYPILDHFDDLSGIPQDKSSKSAESGVWLSRQYGFLSLFFWLWKILSWLLELYWKLKENVQDINARLYLYHCGFRRFTLYVLSFRESHCTDRKRSIETEKTMGRTNFQLAKTNFPGLILSN